MASMVPHVAPPTVKSRDDIPNYFLISPVVFSPSHVILHFWNKQYQTNKIVILQQRGGFEKSA
jgi:hypothetical protein